MKLFIAILAVVVAWVWGYNFGSLDPRVTSTDHAVTRAVCDYSHLSQNEEGAGALEEACGLALDVSNTIYFCTDPYTIDTVTDCWLEDRKEGRELDLSAR